MRRVHLRCHTNILKRLLVHACAFNLSLLMRTLTGIGTPRSLCATSPMWRNCEGDGGRSSEGGMQVQPSNHLKLLWSKAMVVSVEEKAPGRRQV